MAKPTAESASNIISSALSLPCHCVKVKKIMPPIKIKTAQVWFPEMVLVPDAKPKRIKGMAVPMIGITRETWPIFRALNIKYAPKVQSTVDREATPKTSKVGVFVKGMAKTAKKETKLI